MKKLLACTSATLLLAACTPVQQQKAEDTSTSSSSISSTAQAPATQSNWRTFVKPSDEVLRKQLTPLQYQVTQQEGTEPPYNNPYWDNHEVGIYVDIVSGEPLFSSLDKYDSGTGWPSFTKPLMAENIVTKTDTLLGYERTEVRSKHGESHLGHLFDDGPEPTGLRYCMDSASLRFIPKSELKAQGYGDLESLFR